MLFEDRRDAGRQLARELQPYAGQPEVLVLGLPRGGLPVALEVARGLNVPLDLFTVRKLGVPGHEELAMGAIATGNVRVLNQDVVAMTGVSDEMIDRVAGQERRELERRERSYRGDLPPPDVSGRTVILVDDGLATGATMRAAVTAVKEQTPGKIIVAVPAAAPQTCDEFEADVDEMICLATPEPFFGVGRWYQTFDQTTDDEVREILDTAQRELPAVPRRQTTLSVKGE